MNLPLTATEPLTGGEFAVVRRRAIFECHKWDPQVEDVCTIAPFALRLPAETWRELVELAEGLAAEAEAALAELRRRPELHSRLGLSWRLRRALRAGAEESSPAGVSLQRFDFHFTTEGWRISETNSDVPGGFNEASGLARLMRELEPETELPGDPVDALAEAIADACPCGGHVAMVHATAFTDDRQVMLFLARRLERLGLCVTLAGPDQLHWQNGRAGVEAGGRTVPMDFLFRFFPAEWLPNLPRGCGWRHFFHGARTPVCNPAAALLTQSKRFPLVWDELSVALPLWRRLLPETCDPREVDWRRDRSWVLKPACGRVGDLIGLAGVTPEKEWRRIASDVRWHPGYWVAQRRFETLPVPAAGPAVYPCLGVYTVNGRAAGIYGRVAVTPLINHLARDCAVLVTSDAPVLSPLEPPFHHEPCATV